MEYSITSLAKKTRITGRTLRHYDQIGLLKPLIRMTNSKRVYSDEQFMRLCEIVFFKRRGEVNVKQPTNMLSVNGGLQFHL